MLPVFPSNQLELPEQMTTALLGTFWDDTYDGKDQVLTYMASKLQLEKQTFNDIQLLGRTGGVQSCPLYRRLLWQRLVLLESELTVDDLGVGAVSFPVDPTLAAIPVICSQLTNPAVTLIDWIDYQLDQANAKLIFAINPFVDVAMPVEDILDSDGDVTDRQITLWLYQADYDKRYLANTYGYILGTQLASSTNYYNLVNALWDSLIAGPTLDQVYRVIAAITDVPLSPGDETVEVIATDSNLEQLVITDKRVYRIRSGDVVAVSVGQVLTDTTFLTEACAIYKLNRGQLPPIAELELAANFFDSTITGPLTWTNANTAVTVTLGVSGYTRLSWSLGGDAGDVTQFFDLLHQRGVDADPPATLANYLDNRPQPQITQPGASNVPATINPMQFLIENVLRYHGIVVVVKEAQYGPNQLPLALEPMLKTVIAPQDRAFFVFEV